MRASPVKAVTWLEPAFFKKQDRGYKWPPRYAHVICALMTFLFTVLPWITSNNKDGPEVYWILPIAGLFIGGIGGYGISLLDFNLPSNVSVEGNGITRIDSWLGFGLPILLALRYRIHTWNWQQIESGQLETSTDHRLAWIITLYHKNHSVLGRIGVPPKVDIETIRALFLNKQKTLLTPTTDNPAPS